MSLIFQDKALGYSLYQLEHWLIGLSNQEKQLLYEEQRSNWRRLNNIPDKMNVKGSNVIPQRIMK